MTIGNTSASQKILPDLPFDELGLEGIRLKVDKILVYKKSQIWEIHIITSHYISYNKMSMLQKKLQDYFFDIEQIRIRLSSQKSLNEIIHDFTHIWKDMQEYIQDDMPSVTWLDSSSCHWEGNVLNICVSQSAKLDIATHKEVPQWIEEWFRNTFLQSIKVNIYQEDKKDSLVPDTYFEVRKQEELELVRQATMLNASTEQKQVKQNSSGENTVLLGRA